MRILLVSTTVALASCGINTLHPSYQPSPKIPIEQKVSNNDFITAFERNCIKGTTDKTLAKSKNESGFSAINGTTLKERAILIGGKSLQLARYTTSGYQFTTPEFPDVLPFFLKYECTITGFVNMPDTIDPSTITLPDGGTPTLVGPHRNDTWSVSHLKYAGNATLTKQRAYIAKIAVIHHSEPREIKYEPKITPTTLKLSIDLLELK